MDTAFISHDDCTLHNSGEHHPECKQRLHSITEHLIMEKLWDRLKHFEAPEATRAQLAMAHSEAHIDNIESLIPEEGIFYIEEDTAISRHSLRAAKLSAGSVVLATELVLDKVNHPDLKRAFCAVRPPGHHAERERAMGFCLFNNVAVGAYQALNHPDIERIAIVDFDVHHGNGTENIFQHDSRVLFCSAFQHPFYPFTDFNFPGNNIVHVPMSSGTNSEQFRSGIERVWLPELRKFEPQMIYISAGFDGSLYDPMANWQLLDEDYFWITEQICKIADQYSEGRVVSALEGGYQLEHLGLCVVEHIKALNLVND
jgi:acetoin utilization deacetylase AcuC-like enzyme